MCTLAWGENHQSLWICFNRDELRTRKPAEAPAIHHSGKHSLVYARDPQGGGTWFAVSGAGFAVALLNNYPSGGASPVRPVRSRGRLVLDLAATDDPIQALHLLKQENLADYSPFCLFLLAPGTTLARTWDGTRLELLEYERPFWSTSSYKPEEVVAWRTGWWLARVEERAPGLAEASRLMRQTWPEDPAFGLTMDRADARTWSQIEVALSPEGLEFAYRQREPDGLGYRNPDRLHLSA